ncbi:MAG: 3-dehydroquinate synthase [Vicinamibacterales bacterium]
MPSTTIDVTARAGRYRVVVDAGAQRRLGSTLEQAGLTGPSVVVSSPRVWSAIGQRFGRTAPILVPDGERAKTLATVARVYDRLVDANADRGVTVVAVGGGVIGDMVGFAAATYLRGVGLVHVPTTLMAQVDSAIGGKVGVNLAHGKNLVGAFHPPSLVLVDPEALGSLSRREFRSGLYEVVKYGLIAEPALLDRLDRELPAILSQEGGALADVIATSCRIKASVVSEDERELGVRRILNFGHTVGHALEAVTDYRRLRHGEAVAHGMRAALALGVARGLTPPSLADRAQALLARLGPLPTVADLAARDVLDAMRRDKKIVRGRLHFVVIGPSGPATVTDVTPREFTRALTAIGIRG